ncbi:hypothetical protein GBF38_006502, partial [Nibea albiflora]
ITEGKTDTESDKQRCGGSDKLSDSCVGALWKKKLCLTINLWHRGYGFENDRLSNMEAYPAWLEDKPVDFVANLDVKLPSRS